MRCATYLIDLTVNKLGERFGKDQYTGAWHSLKSKNGHYKVDQNGLFQLCPLGKGKTVKEELDSLDYDYKMYLISFTLL